MATEYRKFELVPGQQAPSGSTGVSLSDSKIVWIGEEGTFPVAISSSVMTQDEIDEYIWITEFPDRMTAAKTIFEDSIMWDVNYANVDTYIDNNVTDLAKAKAYLKILSKVVLANLKFNGLVK